MDTMNAKITNELLDAVFYKSHKYEGKWIVTKTISRYVIVENLSEVDSYLLKKETFTEESKAQIICKLSKLQDLTDIMNVLCKLGGIHDMRPNEKGEIVEHHFNIEERIKNYYSRKEEKA